eukprot:746178-Hanusia_phi.AAC.1
MVQQDPHDAPMSHGGGVGERRPPPPILEVQIRSSLQQHSRHLLVPVPGLEDGPALLLPCCRHLGVEELAEDISMAAGCREMRRVQVSAVDEGEGGSSSQQEADEGQVASGDSSHERRSALVRSGDGSVGAGAVQEEAVDDLQLAASGRKLKGGSFALEDIGSHRHLVLHPRQDLLCSLPLPSLLHPVPLQQRALALAIEGWRVDEGPFQEEREIAHPRLPVEPTQTYPRAVNRCAQGQASSYELGELDVFELLLQHRQHLHCR